MLRRVDADGNDAGTVAQIFAKKRGELTSRLLDELGVVAADRWGVTSEDGKKRRQELRAASTQRMNDALRAREEARVMDIQSRYQPLHKALFAPSTESDAAMLDPRFFALGGGEAAAVAAVEAMRSEGVFRVLCEGVVGVPVLSAEGCRLLLEEAKHFEETMGEEDVRRPNSMNNYGVVSFGNVSKDRRIEGSMAVGG